MLTEKRQSYAHALKGKTVLITGAGGGIGYEAAKAFAYMGATLILAEIDRTKGTRAEQTIRTQFPDSAVAFYEIDLADEQQIRKMYACILQTYGVVDVLFHNAAITYMGNVEDVPLENWDKSYGVNFRAPLLLTSLFLPHMRARDAGTIVFVPSSGAAPYMGAYEVFKTAQVELCNTLAGELEDTHVHTYAIAPGLVKTETAIRGIEIVAQKMGMSTDDFYEMNSGHILSAEEAGYGFALSVLHAEAYHGQEIGSVQVLSDCGLLGDVEAGDSAPPDEETIAQIQTIIRIYREQYAGWLARNVFERQWVLRDFKKTVGMSAEQFHKDMLRLEKDITVNTGLDLSGYGEHFVKLRRYYQRQYKLLQGFEKDPHTLKEHSSTLLSWIHMLEALVASVGKE